MSLRAADFVTAKRIRVERHWFDRVVRVGVSLGLLCGAYVITRQAIAMWHFRRGSLEEIRQAIEWDPRNAAFYVARARALRMSVEGTEVNEVIRLGEAATRLRPHRAAYWTELGGSYEWAGREEDAQRAYERARELFPNSPEINWQLGNFHIRAGRTQEALRAFHKTLLGDPHMRGPVFDLAWRAGIDPQMILAEMIPSDQESLFAYLNYLAQTQRLDEANRVWTRLLESGARLEPQAAFSYLDVLIAHQKADELRAAWARLAERNPALSRWGPSAPNQITNADFENEILNGGLDWRVAPVAGVVVRVDSLRHFDGAHSLEITFEGTRNVDYAHVVQFVPVKPDTGYRFVGYLRAERITTDSGPHFVIQDAGDSRRFQIATEGVVGTLNWMPQQLAFRTGPETRLLSVRVARLPSRKFDNLISGTVWIDHVNLTPVE